MPGDIRHPLFARFFDRLSRSTEPEVGRRREELLAGLTGRVLELGAGNGINFPHYPVTVEQVVAVEPEPYLRAKAQRAVRSSQVPVLVTPGVADELEFPDSSFDAAVASLVLCTVPDLPRALSELRRVLKVGGELRFFEHVRSSSPIKARTQAIADRSGIWPRILGGCHAGRETVHALEVAGFRVERCRSVDVGPSWIPTNPHVLGCAVS